MNTVSMEFKRPLPKRTSHMALVWSKCFWLQRSGVYVD
jgi:hypothetical protein